MDRRLLQTYTVTAPSGPRRSDAEMREWLRTTALVARAAADYERRVAEGRPYEDALSPDELRKKYGRSVDVDALIRCASCQRELGDEPGPDDVCASCYRAPDG